MIEDTTFWQDECDSPLLSRGFDVFLDTKNEQSNCISDRVRSWPSLLPFNEKVRVDVSSSSKCSPEVIRIFERDAERTFISKDDPKIQERTVKRQQKQVDNLKLVYSEVQDYHQGMGYIVAFLQLFLEAEELAEVVVSLHRSPRHSAGYFRSEPQAFVRDARVLKKLAEELVPEVSSHLARFGVVPEMYSVKWFVGLAVHVLPLVHLLDFWEGFFQYGYEWVFAFALEYLREFKAELLAESSTAGVMTILRLEDPRAEWRYPPKLQDGLGDRLAKVNLAELEAEDDISDEEFDD
eukprot:TRINITY_DN10156_c0_g1_i1.p1 TRINITY_DN10156_c0_g1~~TRINITY_DN10156_c0_g1_i1.p1  ORF type:complete len:294 (+),score=56.72 TRINITY_DN10156_c0_g1_i1:70-951(+)